MRILEGLKKISDENLVSFHMPGHKNGRLLSSYFSDFFRFDITEIPGADNLHDPNEMILESEKRISDYYGSIKSYILVNGSTSGIYSALMNVCKPGEKVIISRECHRSVYSAMIMGGFEALYIYPEIDEDTGIYKSIQLSTIQNIIENNIDIVGVVLTSPNYAGIMSDVKKIANYLHEKGKILIVDEAHGAHLELSKSLPMSAVRCGADIVIQSIHKTLPALTQSSVIHVNSRRININRLEQLLNIHQSSSPSYLLMASVDAAIDIAINRGEKLMLELLDAIDYFEERLKTNNYLKRAFLERIFAFDPTRIVLVNKSSKRIDFKQLELTLRKKHHIQVEYSYDRGIVFIPSIANTLEDFKRLADALKKIDYRKLIINNRYDTIKYTGANVNMTLKEAFYKENETVHLNDCINRTSGSFIIPYPPGVPLIVPGEILTDIIIATIKSMLEVEINVIGIENDNIEVLKEA